MRRLAVLALPVLALAAPAMAQDLGSTGCAAHRSDEIRCAMRFDVNQVVRSGGNVGANAELRTISIGGRVNFTVDLWSSACGSAGSRVASTQGQAEGQATVPVGGFSIGRGDMDPRITAGQCVEAYITNCTVNGQRTSCQQALGVAISRLNFSRR